MSNKTDSNLYTVLFAIGMVVVVGALLAFTAASLKPTIKENERMEKQQNILYAMGVNDNGETDVAFISTDKVSEAFSKYITKQIVIEGNDVKENDEAYLIDVKKEQAKAKAGETRRLPLFIGEKDGNTFYVAPIYGKGLWDAIWGYIAMDKDMVVQGVYFDHKGETPGLGAEINQSWFEDQFKEKQIMDNSKFVSVKVIKGGAPAGDTHGVDAISGGTLTSNGVTNMVQERLQRYLAYFKNN